MIEAARTPTDSPHPPPPSPRRTPFAHSGRGSEDRTVFSPRPGELRSGGEGRAERVILLLLNLLLLIPVILYTLNSLSIRYYGDDYCVGVEVQQYGVLGAAVYFYNTWVGRLTALVAHGALLELGGWQVGAAATVLLCALWWALLYALGRHFARWRGLPHLKLMAAAGASVVFLATFGFIEIMQAVYWLPGMTMYFLPLILGAAYAWLVMRAGWLPLIAGAALAFAAALCSDVYALTQMELIGLGLLLWWRHRDRRRALVVGLIVSALALLILLIAPGNDARIAATSPNGLDLGAAALQTLFSPAIMLWRTLELNGFPLYAAIAAALIIPAAAAFAFDRAPARRLWLPLIAIPILICLVIMAFWFPTAYLSSTWAPRRAWVAPQVAAVLLWMAWGYVWGLAARNIVRSPSDTMGITPPDPQRVGLEAASLLKQAEQPRSRGLSPTAGGFEPPARGVQFAFAALLIASLLLSAGSLTRGSDVGSQLNALAAWWAEADADLRAAAGQPIEVTLPRPPGTLGTLRVLSAGAAGWPNHCLSRYFGVAAVTMRDP